MTSKIDVEQIGICPTEAFRETFTETAGHIRQMACNTMRKAVRMLVCAMILSSAACDSNIISNSGVYYNNGLED